MYEYFLKSKCLRPIHLERMILSLITVATLQKFGDKAACHNLSWKPLSLGLYCYDFHILTQTRTIPREARSESLKIEQMRPEIGDRARNIRLSGGVAPSRKWGKK